MNSPRLGLTPALLLVGGCLLFAAAATAITIINEDGVGEGFNDPTAAAPVGGNPGTTVGQQRLNAFNFAASIWEGILDSAVEVRIGAKFDPLTCGATSGVLGAAGPSSLHRDYPDAPVSATWYVDAEADMHTGADRRPGQKDISATFNSMLGTTGCLETSAWYYGLDENEPAGTINLVIVLLHEFSHGLGFLSLVDENSGAPLGGFMDAYSRYLLDTSSGLHWDQMNDTQRAASVLNTGNLVWDGPTVTGASRDVLCAPTVTDVSAPAAIAGSYESPLAGFGAGCTAVASGMVVLANDGVGLASDACTVIGQDLSGKIALIDRGTCTFAAKALNAQNAGAIAAIVVNNVADAPFSMGGDGTGLAIPAVMISQADGNLIKTQLGAGVTATVGPDPSRLSGADSSARVQLYNPNPVEQGSSISHWTTDAVPNLLMEPAINSNLGVEVDLTRQLFNDIGWEFFSVGVTRLPGLGADRLASGVLLSWQVHPDLLSHSVFVHREQATVARTQISPAALPWGTTSFLDTTAPEGPVDYWLELVSPTGGQTWQGPLSVTGTLPGTRFSFAPGFPNPFRTETRLAYTLPAAGEVRVTVHDLRGRLVRELVNGRQAGGTQAVNWDGRDNRDARSAAGVYYARIVHEGVVRSQKIVLMN
jgi:hypothetical protein